MKITLSVCVSDEKCWFSNIRLMNELRTDGRKKARGPSHDITILFVYIRREESKKCHLTLKSSSFTWILSECIDII